MNCKEAADLLGLPVSRIYSDGRYKAVAVRPHAYAEVDLSPEQWRALWRGQWPTGRRPPRLSTPVPLPPVCIGHCGQWHAIHTIPMACPVCGQVLFQERL